MQTLSDEYAAGFFDGEGSVYAATRRRHSKYASPTIVVCISNTNKEVIDQHKKQWGGSIHERKYRGKKWQKQYQWVICTRNAEAFLRGISDHVIIKKEVVEKALEYIELMKTPHKERIDYSNIVKKPNGKLQVIGTTKPEFRKKRDAIHNAISKLNKRGAPYNVLRKYS